MIRLGQKIDAFEVPVCNIFQATIWNNQLCYKMDLNNLKDELDIKYQLKDGIAFILDFNEERQFENVVTQEGNEIKVRNYIFEEEDNSVQVHLDSIGKQIFKIL